MKDERKDTERMLQTSKVILKAELNSANIMENINTLAMAVVQYSFDIINWTLQDLRRIETKISKLLDAIRCIIYNLTKTDYISKN